MFYNGTSWYPTYLVYSRLCRELDSPNPISCSPIVASGNQISMTISADSISHQLSICQTTWSLDRGSGTSNTWSRRSMVRSELLDVYESLSREIVLWNLVCIAWWVCNRASMPVHYLEWLQRALAGHPKLPLRTLVGENRLYSWYLDLSAWPPSSNKLILWLQPPAAPW